MNKKDKEFSKKIKVLLLEGFSRQSLPMMKYLHKCGCFLATYNSSRLDVGFVSRYPDKKYLLPWNREDEKESLKYLIELISNEKFDVVIPTTDFSASLCSKHKKELLSYAQIAVNDWDVFQLAYNKMNTMLACIQCGVPCPKTLLNAHSLSDLLSQKIEYPVVMKPCIGYGSIGFHIIKNEEELIQKYEKTKKEFGELLIQEYIPQTDIQYKCEMLIDKNGNVKSAVVFNKVRWYPIDGGSTCCSATVDRPDIINYCSKLLKHIKWVGYADVDLIQDPRDNTPKVMEINPRITASVKICFYAGVDFAKQIIQQELGKDIEQYNSYILDRRLRYFHTDLLWFFKSKNRFKSKPSWFSWYRTVDQIWSWADPIPWFSYTIQCLKKYKKESKKRER